MVDSLPCRLRERIWLRTQALLWPPTCVLCGAAGQSPVFDLCAPCEADLPINSWACSMCAQPLQGTGPKDVTTSLRCGACLRRPRRFDSACCPFRYAYPLDHLVRALKYHGDVAHGRVLGELLAYRIQQTRTGKLPDLLLPVPLASRRFRERGYNQAIELARCIERRLQIPMRTDLVTRIRETREQAALRGRERRRNIRGAFEMTGQLPASHVAIVDDVVTTGSTVNELARILKRAGVAKVEVWAVARTGGASR